MRRKLVAFLQADASAADQRVASPHPVVAESEYLMRFVERIPEFIPFGEKFVWLLEQKQGYGPIEMFGGSNSSEAASGRYWKPPWPIKAVNQGQHGIEHCNGL